MDVRRSGKPVPHRVRRTGDSTSPRTGRFGLWCVAFVLFLSAPVHAGRETYLAFDGNDVVVSQNVTITGAVTVEAWIRPTTISNSKSQDRIVSKDAPFELMISTGDNGCSFGTSGHVQWRAKIGSNDSRICGGSLTTSVWQHVAGTYDGTRFRLYVNGTLVADAARTGAMATNTQSIVIGNRQALDRGFHGDIDEVRIWSRALSQAELQSLMNGAPQPADSALQAWYGLNETTGQVAADSSINYRNATLGTSASPDAADPLWMAAGGVTNRPPVVDAGPDQTVTLPNSIVNLLGIASDDGLPAATLAISWSQVSGPAPVTFQNPYALQTSASLPIAGTYQLQITANDGELSGTDTVTIIVAANSVTSIVVSPSSATILPGGIQRFTAEGRNASGQIVAITPVWSATGGKINQAGRYTAGTKNGQYTITATSNGVSGQATVTLGTTTAIIWPTNGWQPATPAELGMSSSKLAQARDFALTGAGSGYITRHGRLAMSWGDPAVLYDLKSSTKSLAGTALGLALGDGLVQMDDFAQTWLPSIGIPPSSNANTGWLGDMKLLHLATHTSGFVKSATYDAITFKPGTKWQYSDGAANWLADVLTVRFGQDLNTVMFSRVFTPLGVKTTDLKWRNNANHTTTLNGIKTREFGSGFTANVDAMAKIGYLYLRRGNWNGQQILPESYIDLVGHPSPLVAGVPVTDPVNFPYASSRYGVLWWTNANTAIAGVPADAFWSWGLHDSLVVVIPSLDIVISRAGNGWRPGWNPDYVLLTNFLLPIASSVTGP